MFGIPVINHAEDVFYLTLEEVKEALSATLAPQLTDVAQGRREDRDRFMRMTPPQFLGKAPSDDILSYNSEASKFVRAVYIPLTEERPSLLRGAAGSRGHVSGIARLVEGQDEFWKVQPGDILVCRSTSPPWTPLFAVIGASSPTPGVCSHTAPSWPASTICRQSWALSTPPVSSTTARCSRWTATRGWCIYTSAPPRRLNENPLGTGSGRCPRGDQCRRPTDHQSPDGHPDTRTP